MTTINKSKSASLIVNDDFTVFSADENFNLLFGFSQASPCRKLADIFPIDKEQAIVSEIRSQLQASGYASLSVNIEDEKGDEAKSVFLNAVYCTEDKQIRIILTAETNADNKAFLSIPFSYDYISDTLVMSKEFIKHFGKTNIFRDFAKNIITNETISDHSIDVIADFITMKRTTMEHGTANLELKDKSGEYHWYSVNISNTFDINGNPVKATGFISNTNINSDKDIKEGYETDSATGLYTKSTIENLLRRRLKDVSPEYPATIVLIKLDDMVTANSRLGHMAVDTLISYFAFGLLRQFPTNIIGRMGGIDFLVYIEEKDSDVILEQVKSIHDLMNTINIDAGIKYPITLSIGVCHSDVPLSYSVAMERSDAALCHAKSLGGNQYVYFSDEIEGEALLDKNSSHEERIVSEDFTGRMWAKLIDKLYNAPDIASGIYSAIAFLGHTFKVDRITVFELPNLYNKIPTIIQWCAKDIPSTVDYLEALDEDTLYSVYLSSGMSKDSEIIYAHSVSDLDGVVKDTLQALGISSHLQCNLSYENSIIGFTNFEMCGNSRVWIQQEIDLLKLMSKLIEEDIKQQRSISSIKALHNKTLNIISSIASGIYIIDKDSYNILYYNEAMKKIAPNIDFNSTCYKAIMGIDSPCEKCSVQSINDLQKTSSIAIKSPVLGGTFDVVSSEMIWDNEKPAYVINFSEHIETTEESEFRKMQEKLEKKYAFIYSHSCDYIIDIDLNSNSYTKTIFNENAFCPVENNEGNYDEMFMSTIDKFVHPDDIRRITENNSISSIMKMIRSGKVDQRTEYRFILDNAIHWEESHAFFINSENSPSIVIAFRDITEQKYSEEIAALDRQRLYLAVSNIYPLVMSVNLTKNSYSILRHSDFNGSSAKEADGKYTEYIDSTLNLYPDEYHGIMLEAFACDSLIAAFSDNNTQVYREMRKFGADSKYHWVSILAIHVDNTFDDDVLAIILCRNIDEQKEAENNLRLALSTAESASSAKSDFLSRMSHEIRTPMNAIIGMTELARSSSDKPGYIQECLTKIDVSSHYLLSIINDILDMSRIENNRVILSNEDFNFREFVSGIETLISPQAKDKGIDFSIVESGISSEFYVGDQIRIKQVIVNLISNSLKFTERGGIIRLEIEEKQCVNETACIKFSVIDTGCGMSPEFLRKMYKPFEQESANNVGKGHGTGLGLSISKNLVTLMGGHIQVKSKVGVGTTFDVELNLKISDNKLPENSRRYDVSIEDCDFSGKRILLAEDNEINCEIAVALLEMKNLKVDCAEDGQQAVDKFSASEINYYDAILMDIMMPYKNGLEASKEIREMNREDAKTIPIIAMTANAFSEDITKSFAHGMNDHLAKPIEPDKLYNALKFFILNNKQ